MKRMLCKRSLLQTLPRWILWGSLAALLFALLAQPAAAQPGPVTAEDFWQRLEETRAWLETNPAPDTWEAQAQRWEAVELVLLPDGRALPIQTRELVRLLRAKPPSRAAAAQHVNALLRMRDTWAGSAEKTAEKDVLEQVLARPEFQGAAEGFLDRLRRRFLEFFWELLDRLFPSSAQVSLIPPWLGIVLAAALLGGILAYVFRDTWKNMLHEAALAEAPHGEDEILSAQQATQRAQQLATSGDYRLAVRYLYLSALLLLDERGLLHYNRTQTNREYLRQVAGSPAMAGHLRAVVDTFDRVWYGFQVVDESEYTRYAEQVRLLEEGKE